MTAIDHAKQALADTAHLVTHRNGDEVDPSTVELNPFYEDAIDMLEAAPAKTISIVTLQEFAAVDEATAVPLLGDGVIVAGGALIMYGEAGCGKTSMQVDAAFHLAAGIPWLGLATAKKARVLLVENEGPRGPYRLKLRAKLAAWDSEPIDDRISVLDDPWGRVDLRLPSIRELLVAWIQQHDTDVVMLGPLNKSGTEGAGTLDEVNAFEDLRLEITAAIGRPLAWWMVHHTNRGGNISGAWEPMPDTLIRVRGDGNRRSVFKIEKARWSPANHGVRLTLAWLPGERYDVVERSDTVEPKVGPETYEQRVLDWITLNPWATTDELDNGVEGRAAEVRKARQRLEEAGRLSSATSASLGRPGKGKRWNLSNHAAQNPVPGLGTPQDEEGAAPPKDDQPRPGVPALKGTRGRDGVDGGVSLEPDETEIERLASIARQHQKEAL